MIKCTYNELANPTHNHILVATYDFQKSGILTSVDSDEPVQPPVKLRNSKSIRSVALQS